MLPLLAPDRTLRIAALPSGEDPDSIVRRQGSAGFRAVLESARPLGEALYDLLRETAGEATPEQRAAFRTKLEDAARRIPDRALASEYRRVLLDRFYAATRRGGQRQRQQPNAAMRRPIPRPQPASPDVARERARILTAILLRHPELLHEVDHAYAALDLPASLAAIREAILAWVDHREVLDSRALIDHLTISGLQAEVDFALAAVPVPLPACASSAAMPAEAHEGWWHIFGFLSLERLQEEVKAAQLAAASDLNRDTEARARALKEALNKVMAGEPDGVERAA